MLCAKSEKGTQYEIQVSELRNVRFHYAGVPFDLITMAFPYKLCVISGSHIVPKWQRIRFRAIIIFS